MRRQFRDTILDLARNDDSMVLIFGDVSVYLFQGVPGRVPSASIIWAFAKTPWLV